MHDVPFAQSFTLVHGWDAACGPARMHSVMPADPLTSHFRPGPHPHWGSVSQTPPGTGGTQGAPASAPPLLPPLDDPPDEDDEEELDEDEDDDDDDDDEEEEPDDVDDALPASG
jgi:hypothetical protein